MPLRLVPGVYAVTDCERLSGSELLDRTSRILEAGVSAVQYRNKSGDAARKAAEAAAIGALCRQHGVPLVINDDVDLALAVGADGIHLGADDESCTRARARLGTGGLIGISCYDNMQTAVAAQDDGADYVAFGAFYPTRTKQPRSRADIELLERASRQLHIPIVAIGGITPDNAAPLLAAGADLLAVVSSLYGDPDPAAVVRRFRRLYASTAAAKGHPA